MATFYDALDDKLTAFIEAQPMFFIASATASGRVNLSPKGLDTFAVLSPSSCAYLDLTGSGNETSAHAEAGGRATIMFCSFTRNPLILRLYGSTRIGRPGSALWREMQDRFDDLPGARQIIAMEIESVQTACGFGVPVMTVERERTTLTDHWRAKGEEETERYRERKNKVSIDGLRTGWGEDAF
jgi:hypothetical protein